MPYDHSGFMERVAEYKHKAKVLRQIHSNKMKSFGTSKSILDYGTVIASLCLTFLAFFGIQRLHTLFLANVITFNALEFVFNVLILVVLILSFMQMTLKLGEKQVDCLNSVKILTHFITDLDDLAVLKDVTPQESEAHIIRLNDRYENITGILPASTDAEWRKAKDEVTQKDKS